MKKIELCGKDKGTFLLVNDEDFEELNKWKWYLQKTGYVYRSKSIKNKSVKTYLHRLLLNAPRGSYIDHVNRDSLDNRRENLRLCTNAQNGANSKIKKNNTSGYKGVYWNKLVNKWIATIHPNGRSIYLGMYLNIKEAALAYNNAAKKFYGEFAQLNSI